jgi:hypothetical protein
MIQMIASQGSFEGSFYLPRLSNSLIQITFVTLAYSIVPQVKEDIITDDIVSCLSGPTHQVYAFYNDSYITTDLISCTKMHTLRSIPYNIMPGYDKILQLNWSTPACTHCEVKGKRCLLKNNKSETECGPKINKGIVFYPMNFHLCSLRLQPSMNSFWPILAYKCSSAFISSKK